MGCDIDYVLDNELWNLSSQEFLKEFEKRIGQKIHFADKESEISEGWIFDCFSTDFCELWDSLKDNAKEKCELNLVHKKDGVEESYWFQNKTVIFYFNSSDSSLNGFVPDDRWYNWSENYFEKKDSEIIGMTDKTLDKIKKEIATIFGSKKLLVCGSSRNSPSENELQEFSIDEFLSQNENWKAMQKDCSRNKGDSTFIGDAVFFVAEL